MVPVYTYNQGYSDVIYNEFNPFILLWIPFYIAACLIEAGYRKGTQMTS